MPASSDIENRDPTPQSSSKRIKITAWNGVASWRAYEKEQRRLKREQKRDGVLSVQAPKVNKVKGKLASLPKMPLDILFEIFAYLLPLDLLRLARTTKGLREILMRKSSAFVWKAARSNVPNFPDCPEDLTEPQYANLAFDVHCQNCLTNNVRNVDWTLRTRYCSKCVRRYMDYKPPDQAVKYLPHSKRNGNPVCLVKDVRDWEGKYKKLEKDPKANKVCKKEMKEKIEQIKEHARLCQIWERGMLAAREDEMDEIRIRRRDDIIDRLTGLGWEEEIDLMPTVWNAEMYLSRRYNDQDEEIPWLFDEHPLVKQTKPLTDRIWKNIRGRMVRYMESVKARRLEEEKEKRVKSRKNTLTSIYKVWKMKLLDEDNEHEFDIVPPLLDFMDFPPVKALIEDKDEEMGLRYVLQDIIINKAYEELLRLSREWRDIIKRTLYEQVNEYAFERRVFGPDFRSSEDLTEFTRARYDQRLKLATSVFICLHEPHFHKNSYDRRQREYGAKEPFDGLWYPNFLHHRCNTLVPLDSYSDSVKLEKDPSRSLGEGFASMTVRGKWSAEKLAFDEQASAVVEKIVEACGRDPGTTTVEEMDRLDPRIVCVKCSFGHRCDGERRVAVRSWRAAVKHCMQTHWADASTKWEVVKPEDAEKARVLEKEAIDQMPASITKFKGPEAVWVCAACKDTGSETDEMTKMELREHMQTDHFYLTVGEEDKDYVRSLGAPPRQPPVVYMVPGPCGKPEE